MAALSRVSTLRYDRKYNQQRAARMSTVERLRQPKPASKVAKNAIEDLEEFRGEKLSNCFVLVHNRRFSSHLVLFGHLENELFSIPFEFKSCLQYLLSPECTVATAC